MTQYEGWKNYPTWAVKLWLDNDEALYQDYRRINRKCRDVSQLANALQDWIEEVIPSLDGLAGDLLNYSLGIVDWQEIAEAIREEYLIEDEIEDELG